MRKYSDTKANKIIGILLVILIVACFILVIIRNQLNQHITEICEYKCKELANSAIATAINEQLKGSVDNKNYISVQRNNNNEIISIETNTEEINKLQAEIKTKINKALKNIPDERVYVPIGTLSGITFLSGRGPDIILKLHQLSVVNSKIISEFSSAGLNQTRHRLLLKVSIEITAIIPFNSTDVVVSNDYIVSETVIVGEVPNGYITTNK